MTVLSDNSVKEPAMSREKFKSNLVQKYLINFALSIKLLGY
jgi:hypothetical protein